MRIFTLLFLISSLASAQDFNQDEDIFWYTTCKNIGEDFYQLTFDRQNGKSLASTTSKSQNMINSLHARTVEMLEQDGWDLDSWRDGLYKSDPFLNNFEILNSLYGVYLELVYERYQRPDFEDYIIDEARFIRDSVFQHCWESIQGKQ